MNEQCWILIGRVDEADSIWRVRARRHVTGQPSSVEADWSWALDWEEEHGDVAGFAHTHPKGAGTAPSQRDIRTMRAWCSALGKALLCLIAEGDVLANPVAYLFENDESEPQAIRNWKLIEDPRATGGAASLPAAR